MRTTFVYTLAFCLVGMPRLAVGSPAGVDAAVQWLRDTHISGYGWGEPDSATAIRDTAKVVEALTSLGLGLDPTCDDALAWLAAKTPQEMDSLSRRVIVLNGTLLQDMEDISFLFEITSGGAGLPLAPEMGGESFWVEALALQAMERSARSDLLSQTDLGQRIARIAYTHRGCLLWDGGDCVQVGAWGMVPGGSGYTEPDVVSTSLALAALSDPFFGNVLTDLASIMQTGVAFLSSSFGPDGSAGSIQATCLAILALKESGSLDPMLFANAAAYIRSRQLPDGSWEDDAYLTALAVQLLDEDLPNLLVRPEMITVQPEKPVAGDVATIQVSVENAGTGSSGSFVVSVFDGDPTAGGSLIGAKGIDGLLPGEKGNISVNWAGTTPFGIHEIHAVVDSAGEIEEKDESDNRAAISVRCLPERDVEVLADHMSFTPEQPAPGQSLSVRVMVSNTGGAAIENIAVRFYDGDPDAGGLQIGSDEVVPSLESLQDAWIEKDMGVLTDGPHTIFVVADPDDSIPEAEESNNVASKTITVEPRADLVVTTGGIEPSSEDLYDGDTLLLRARVWNTGDKDVTGVTVRLFEGYPGTGGVQLGQDFVLTIPSSENATTDWITYETLGKGGSHEFFVVVDPENNIEETNELNNLASRIVNVGFLQDLAVTSASFYPDPIEEGTSVLISVTVTNVGSWASKKWKLLWFDGNPDEGGLEFWFDDYGNYMRELKPGDSTTVQAQLDTEGRPFDRPVYVELIPEEPKEISKDNNTMSILLPMITSRPDLEILDKEITTDSAFPVDGDSVNVSVTVRNLRNVSCPSTSIQLFKGKYPGIEILNAGTVPPLGPNGSTIISLHMDTTGLAGDLPIGFWIDPDNLVDEIDDMNNNRAEKTLRIYLPQEAAPFSLTATAIGEKAVDLKWSPGPGADAFGLTGYLIYRDDHLLTTRIDRSKDGVPSASSWLSGHEPMNAIDQDPYSLWMAQNPPMLPEWFQLDFPEKIEFGEVAIYWYGYIPDSFSLEARKDGVWTPLTTTENRPVANYLITVDRLDQPVAADGLRLVVTAVPNSNYFGMHEIDVYEPWPLPELGHVDSPVAPGLHSYYVQGMITEESRTIPSNRVSVEVGDTKAPAMPNNVVISNNGDMVSLGWDANTENDLSGYRVYRNGLNIASQDHGCMALVPEFNSNVLAAEANDDDSATFVKLYHEHQNEFHQYLVLNLEKASTIDLLRIIVTNMPGETYRFRIDGSMDGENWAVLADRSGIDATGEVAITIDPPVQVKMLKVVPVYDNTNDYIELAELEAYSSELQNSVTSEVGSLDIYDSYSSFRPVTKVLSFDTRAPRRFHFSQKSSSLPENNPIIIIDSDNGAELERIDGDLSNMTTRSLVASNYRFVFLPDFNCPQTTVRIKAYETARSQQATSFSENVGLSGEYLYGVTAVDQEGNESRISMADQLSYSDNKTPDPPTGLTAVVSDASIDLSWDSNSETDLGGYNIYRQDLAEPLNGTELLHNTWFNDTIVNNQTTYTYWATAVDINGNESGPSDSLTVVPTGTDLVVGTNYIFPKSPSLLSNVTVVAIVSNIGTAETGPVTVAFYDGDPESGGELIGQTVTDGAINAGGSSSAFYQWKLETGDEGTHHLYMVVDPENSVAETNEINNIANVSIDVHGYPPLNITIGTIYSGNYPLITMPAWIADEDGVGVYGLTRDSFDVKEDGNPVLDLGVVGSAGQQQPHADILFGLDLDNCNPWMVPTFCNTTNSIVTLLEMFGADVLSINYMEGDIFESDICKEIYYDLPCATPTGEVPWTSMLIWMMDHHVWRDNATRIIVAAAPIGSTVNQSNLVSVVERANADNVTIYGLGRDDPAIIQQLTYISSETGGTSHIYEDAMNLAPDIFKRVAADAAQYSISFETPRPARDGTVRNVGTVVTKAEASGVGYGTYVAPMDSLAELGFAEKSLLLDPDTPSAGEAINVTGIVRNDGGQDADGVVVRLYDGEPGSTGVQIGTDYLLGTVEPNQTALVSIHWLATAGEHKLVLVVDPDNKVAESHEDNNEISIAVDVPGDEKPELALTDEDITLSDEDPFIGKEIVLGATIHNLGASVSRVKVWFYDGNPKSNGRMIGQAVAENISSDDTAYVYTNWVVDVGEGDHDIYVWADPLGEIAEGDEENNLAKRTLKTESLDILLAVRTDRVSYPMTTDVFIDVSIVNGTSEAWSGNGNVLVEDAEGNLVDDLGTFSENDLKPVGFAGWHGRLPATMEPAVEDRLNVTLEADVNFSSAMSEAGLGGEEFDPNSVRVMEVAPDGALIDEKPSSFSARANDFDPLSNAVGKVRWLADGVTPGGTERFFYVYFDSIENGPKDPPAGVFHQTGIDIAAVTMYPFQALYMKANLAGGLGPAFAMPLSGSYSTYNYGVATADFTSDGLPDLIVGTSNTDIKLFENLGGGTFADGLTVAQLNEATSNPFDEIAAGDLDSDGDIDFVAGKIMYNQVHAFLNDGTGAFTKVTLPPGPFLQSSNGYGGKALCDFNEDGTPDLVSGMYGAVGGGVWYFTGNGDGTFADPVQLAYPANTTTIACGDFDSDGYEDIILPPEHGRPFRVIPGIGNGTFGAILEIQGFPDTIYKLKVGDFDSDGMLDVLEGRYGSSGFESDGILLYRRQGPLDFADGLLLWQGDWTRGLSVGPYRPEGTLTLGPGEAPPRSEHSLVWNTGVNPPGSYQVRAVLDEGQGPVAEGTAPFTIEESIDVAASVSTDKRSYGANDEIEINSELEILAGNAPLSGAELQVSVMDSGAVEIWSENVPVPELLPGERIDFDSFFNTGANVPGTYTANIELKRGTEVIANAQAGFDISTDLVLNATVTVSPGEVEAGNDATVSYMVENAGNTDAVALPCRLAVTTEAQDAILYELPITVDLAVGETLSDMAIFSSAGYAEGNYLAVFQLPSATGWVTAGYGVFRVVIRDADGDGFTADVDCDDNDPLTYPGANELCDSKDNDCDGQTDEDLGTTTCGLGVCEHTIDNCVAGQTQTCDPLEGSVAETCDLLDNDCDGQTDEDLGTTTCGLGVCEHTVDNCVNGQSQTCDPLEGSTAEACDLLDNDCDGQTDEDFGTTTCGLGICEHTIDNCVGGTTQTCDPLEGSVAEACDVLDNDCDGQTDEDLGTTTCGLGICEHAVDNCVNGQIQTCDPLEGSVAEACDLLDNDCDGQTDEDLGKTTCGLGICEHTVDNCVTGVSQTCDPLEGSVAETCDLLDNDCDGQTDEDLGTTTCGLGVCEHTVDNCVSGQTQTCNPLEGSTAEICDLLDNDCNGIVDDLDEDGDSYSACVDDCDDMDPAVNPGAVEVPGNGKDDDCDPSTPDEALALPEFVQAVCADEEINMLNNALVGSYDPYTLLEGLQGEAATGGPMLMRNNATVDGRVIVWGDLTMKNNALVSGDAYVGGNLDLKNNAWIGGEIYALSQAPPPCGDGYDLAGQMGYVAGQNDNLNLWDDPLISQFLTGDGGMVLGNNDSIYLPGGTYYLAYLEVGNNGSVIVEEGEAVILFIENRINFKNNSSIHNGPDHPEHLYILSGADADAGEEVVVRNNTELGMYLFAPFADVSLDNNADIHGGVVGRMLTIKNNTVIMQPAVELR